MASISCTLDPTNEMRKKTFMGFVVLVNNVVDILLTRSDEEDNFQGLHGSCQ